MGVDDSVIQRILRHSNIATTQAYYIKTATDDVQNAMTMFENTVSSVPKAPDRDVISEVPVLRDTFGTQITDSRTVPLSIN